MSQRFERPKGYYRTLHLQGKNSAKTSANTGSNTGPSASASSNAGPSASASSNNSAGIAAIDPTLLSTPNATDDPLSTSSIVSGDIYNPTSELEQEEQDEESIRTPTTSIQASDSISAILTKAPPLRRTLGPQSWVFDHLITTILDSYHLTKKAKKRVLDRHHKCKYCSWDTTDSQRYGTGNMIDHLKMKHGIGVPVPSRPQESI
jgi:hypothetical protein